MCKIGFVMLSLAGNLPKLLFLGRYNETRHMSMESSNIFRHTMLCLISEMHFVYSYTFSLHLRQKYVLSILSIFETPVFRSKEGTHTLCKSRP